MAFRRPESFTPIQAAEAWRHGELQLVDVRELNELPQARVAGAEHIPLGPLPERLRELDRDRAGAFLCGSGTRSAIATRTAARAGLDAVNVKGGNTVWSRSGLPLLTDSERDGA